MKRKIAKIITQSSLWNLGANSHQALSELTETLYQEILPLYWVRIDGSPTEVPKLEFELGPRGED